MTNLSIRSRLQILVDRGDLFPFKPLSEDEGAIDGPPRWIWLTKDATNFCSGASGDRKIARSLANLHARMANFVRGGYVEYDIDFKRLDEHCPFEEIWELKTRGSLPQLRLFGFFPDSRIFVAVHGMNRDKIKDWNAEGARVNSSRAAMFPAYPLFQQDSFEDYV